LVERAWSFLDADAPVAGWERWTVGVGMGLFLVSRRRKWLIPGVANKALRLGLKMVVSTRLGRNQRGENGCPTNLEAGLGVGVRCGVEMIYVGKVCWTGFSRWCSVSKGLCGKDLRRSAFQKWCFSREMSCRHVACGYTVCAVWLYGRYRIARRYVPCGYTVGAHP
jgi:hypothetical protein